MKNGNPAKEETKFGEPPERETTQMGIFENKTDQNRQKGKKLTKAI